MNKVIKILVMVLGITGIAGCSQEKQAESTINEEKEITEVKETTTNEEKEITEVKESSNDSIINDLIGTWVTDYGEQTKISKINDNLIIEAESINPAEIEVQKITRNQIEGVVVGDTKVDTIDPGTTVTFTLQEDNRLIVTVGIETIVLSNTDNERDSGAADQNEPIDGVSSDSGGLNEDFQIERPYYGEATGNSNVWPFKLTVNKVNTSGDFEGEMEWLTLDAVHKVEGTIFDNRIVFKETEYIKQGSAALNPVYVLQSDDAKKQYTGTWGFQHDEGTAFLEID